MGIEGIFERLLDVNLSTYAAFKLNQGLGLSVTDENKCYQLYCCTGALVVCVMKRINGSYWKLLSDFSVLAYVIVILKPQRSLSPIH